MPGRFLKDNLKFDADHRFELRFFMAMSIVIAASPTPPTICDLYRER